MNKNLVGILAAIVGLLAMAGALAADITVSANVQKYISVTFSYNAVNFGTLTAGSSNNPAPNQGNGVYNVTVDTNYDYTVSAYGTDFSDGAGHTFAISNLKLDTAQSASGLSLSNAVALSGTAQTIDSYGYNVAQTYHGFWLSVPAGQYAAAYTSTVSIIYASQ